MQPVVFKWLKSLKLRPACFALVQVAAGYKHIRKHLMTVTRLQLLNNTK